MPHLSGRCPCGRPIHWPRNAKFGDEWRCFRCGRVWVLSRDGHLPMHTTKSQPPPAQPVGPPAAVPVPYATPTYAPAPPPPLPVRAAGPGCSLVLLVGFVGAAVCWLV